MKKPNILMIMADQMRADCMGFQNPDIKTPNLDALAARGTVFERAYCSSPVCTPSRGSILTGRYPQCNGAWNIGVAVREEEITIADLALKAGYHTGVSGKTHFRPQCKPDNKLSAEKPIVRDRPRKRDGTYYGFQTCHISEDNRIGEYLDWLTETAPQYLPELDQPKGVTGDVYTNRMPQEYHQSHWIAQKGIEYIQEHAEESWLLSVSFVDPHHPFNPPESFARMYEDIDPLIRIHKRDGEHGRRPDHLRYPGDNYWPGGGMEHQKSQEELAQAIRNYYAMITLLDEEIGRLIHTLEEQGILDDTIVLFTADHGELLGDHGLLYKGPWMYEGLVRVPMILAGPGVPCSLRTQALFENVDILPTVMELAEIGIPYGVQGISQMPVLRGETPGVRKSAITIYDAHDRGIVTVSICTGDFKLVVFRGEAYGELYDLRNDPCELENRYEDTGYQKERAMMMELLCQHLLDNYDPLPEKKALW